MPSLESRSRWLLALGACGVLWLSTAEQSAARMLAWPWCLLYGGIIVLPWLALGVALVNRRHVSKCLSRAWGLASVAWGGGLAVSVAASPLRPDLWVWLGVPLAGLAWFGLLRHEMSGRSCSGGIERQGLWPAWIIGGAGAVLAMVSLVFWVADQFVRMEHLAVSGAAAPAGLYAWIQWWFMARNHQPLGHVNFTGGAAVLYLPWLCWLAWRGWVAAHGAPYEAGSSPAGMRDGSGDVSAKHPRLARVPRHMPGWLWTAASLLGLLMLVSSGSRGAWLGLLAAVGSAGFLLWRNRPHWRRRLLLALAGVSAGLCLVVVSNPPLRSALRRHAPTEIPNVSNAERWEMVRIGWKMGLDRPLTGWGTGAVPLAYDAYRAGAKCGPVNMLQVHSTPLNLWAEGGLLLVLPVFLGVVLAARALWRGASAGTPDFVFSPRFPAGLSFMGYAVFALTDYQLDLPIVVFTLATDLAILVPAGRPGVASRRVRMLAAAFSAAAALGLGIVVFRWIESRRMLAQGDIDAAISWQREDTTLRAMRGLAWAAMSGAAADDRARRTLRAQARRDLQLALGRGGHVEFAHYNMGWLWLDEDPAAAAGYFGTALRVAVARPGAWSGLGLARLRLGQRDAAIDALAMECLVDPAYLHSGRWGTAELAGIRADTLSRLASKLAQVRGRRVPGGWPAPQARYLQAVVGWLAGECDAAAVAACADSPEHAEFWRALEGPADVQLHPFFSARKGDRATLRRLASAYGSAGGGAPAGVIEDFLDRVSAVQDTVALRRLLMADGDRQPPSIRTFPPTAGFGVRMRNPYAQRLPFCGPEYRNILAESLLPALLPPLGWLYEDTVRELVGAENRGMVNPLEGAAGIQLQCSRLEKRP